MSLYYDFEESIGYWMIMAARSYQRALDQELGPRGITWRQCQVLGYLALEGDLTQTELAERMMVESPTLVGILDRMQRDGWILRHDCPNDRRKKIIRPTSQAEPVWSEIVECGRRIRARATQGLSESQRETLMELLGKVRENLTIDANVKNTGN